MSALADLKLVAAKKPTHLSPVVIRRNKVIDRLHEQLEMAKARQEGRTYAPTRMRSVKNAETGVKTTIETTKRLKQWWWVTDNGKVCVSLRYGAKIIEIVKGKTAVELASEKELVATLEILKQAVESGELDAQIEAVAGTARNGFRK